MGDMSFVSFHILPFLLAGVVAAGASHNQKTGLRVLLIIVAIAAVHSVIKTFIVPSREYQDQLYKSVFFTPDLKFAFFFYKHQTLIVFLSYFLKDVICVLPAAFIRLWIVKKPIFPWLVACLFLLALFVAGKYRNPFEIGAIACAWLFVLVLDDKKVSEVETQNPA
jgi:hypothetical protein